jgi:glycosyltransferase involved in cell wall biosynthesis
VVSEAWKVPQRPMVAIPAWNESGSVANVVHHVRTQIPHATVVVIDDGSTDDTAAQSTESGAITISLPFNVGVGGAMRTAFLFAQREGFDAVVQVDADGQHNPAEIPELLEALSQADIVVGTRFHATSTYRVRGPRRWAMDLLSWSLSRAAKTPIRDTTSGFRSAGPRAIELFARTYPAEYLGDTVGSLSIAISNGLSITERPVTMYYRRIGTPSKSAIWSTLYLGRASLALLVQLLKRTRPVNVDES